MRGDKKVALLLFLCSGLAFTLLMFFHSVRARGWEPQSQPTIYNPYPSGILPSDVNSELSRVQGEIQFIENEAISEWHALGPVTYTGQPPIIKDNGYQAMRVLGKHMNYDLNISPFRNIACSSCHMPYAGFSGPIPSVNLTMSAYPGSVHFRAGKRNPQRYTYSPDFPVLEYNTNQASFFGGNFWDARATGYELQSPDAHQSQGPPVDTQEHGFPDTACIVFRLSQAVYRPLFEQIWGADSLDIKFPHDTEQICETPGGAKVFGSDTEPVKLSPEDRSRSNDDYNHWAQSVSFFEGGADVSPFTSKFDAFLGGNYTMTADEIAGYNLFRGKRTATLAIWTAGPRRRRLRLLKARLRIAPTPAQPRIHVHCSLALATRILACL